MHLATYGKIELNPNGRTIVMSDIHGNAGHLAGILEKLRFGGDDTLIVVGDLINKGDDNLGTLRMLLELRRRHRVLITHGNVDLTTIKWFDKTSEETDAVFLDYEPIAGKAWGSTLASEMCDLAGLPRPTAANHAEIRQRLLALYPEEIGLLLDTKTVLDAGDFLFVHGGITVDDRQAIESATCASLTKFDDFITCAPAFARWVVTGHYPAMLYRADACDYRPFVDRERKLVALDGGLGLKAGMQINAMIIEGGGFTFDWWDKFPVRTARTAQAGSGDAIHIRWGHNEVELIGREEAWGWVRLLSGGKQARIPAELLYERDGRLFAKDFTDKLLEVKPGDPLSVIGEGIMGWQVKKGSLQGWYQGEFE